MAKQFEVECVSEATGAVAFLMFTADDAEAARQQANAMGYAAGAVAELPAASPTGSAKAQTHSKQPTPVWEQYADIRIAWMIGLAAIVGVLLLVDALDISHLRASGSGRSFEDSSAPGASANSLDRIERLMIRQEATTRRGLYVVVLCTTAVVVAAWPRARRGRYSNP